MPGRPRSLRRPQTDLATVNLPAPVKALPEPMQRAWLARARGATWRETAAAAGVEVGVCWEWAQRHKPFRDALPLAYLEHDDDHRAVLARVLDAALEHDADDKALDRGLRAATHVARGLGIGIGGGASPAHAPVNVQVNVALDVLAAPLPAGASLPVPLDAAGALPVPDDVLDAEWEPVDAVADGAPARSQASARRASGRDD